jgi:glycosyltransferase involved in cell wall biosynthesis
MRKRRISGCWYVLFYGGPRAAALRLVIFSEGEEKEIIEKLAKALGIADRVPVSRLRFRLRFRLCGLWLRHVRLFRCPSRFEGFGNPLVNAMGARVPVLAADFPVGSGEYL